jgi:hypothetical protein
MKVKKEYVYICVIKSKSYNDYEIVENVAVFKRKSSAEKLKKEFVLRHGDCAAKYMFINKQEISKNIKNIHI